MAGFITAIFQQPSDFVRLERKPITEPDGLVEVWGRRDGEQGLSLSYVEADRDFFSLDQFRRWLLGNGYDPIEMYVDRPVIKAVSVGDWVQYAVPKPPGPTTYATGEVVDVSTGGTLTAGQDSVDGSSEDPAVKLRVWARLEDDRFERTDRLVVRPESKLRSINKPEGIVEKQIPLNESIRTALQRKVDEHNEKHGGTPSKRATLRMLEAAMRRGIGAYKENPGSVRPNVRSPEQWGYGRVNGLLYALRTGRFRRTAYDRDLLPKEHKLSTKKSDLDLYPTIEEAERRAAELGCVGHHEHEVDGTVMYMPCAMEDYTEITGLRHRDADEGDLTLIEADLDLDAELFETRAGALARAELLGITGFHTHEIDGRPMYMPGETMGELEAALRSEASRRMPTTKAVWSTAYVNDLPDSAFFYIGPGGEKDDTGRTVPRSLRKLPYIDAAGRVDLPHVRNVLSRIGQTEMPDSEKDRIRREARQILDEALQKFVAKQRYDAIDFSPPKGVREAAELGLALRREHGRGGTLIGVARARDLAGGKSMSPETIKRMVSFFARHEVDLSAPKNRDRSHPEYPGAGRIAWLLWGGDPGRRWAEKIAEQMKREDLAKSMIEDPEVSAVLDRDPSEVSDVLMKSLGGSEARIVSWCPTGRRYLVTKSDDCQQILPEPKPGDDVALGSILAGFPDGYAAEIVVDDTGRSWAVDCVMAANVDIGDLGYGIRKSLLDSIELGPAVEGVDSLVSSDRVEIEARAILDRNPKGWVEIRGVDDRHGRPVSRLSLEESREDLWKYVVPTVADQPEALVVTGSPNRIESIRGLPLAGPDGSTFRSSYLDRLGLAKSSVSIVHACPEVDGDPSLWRSWLAKQLDSHRGIPVIALGRQASAAIGEIGGYQHTTLPHPRAIRRRGDRGEIARKSKSIRKAIDEAREAGSGWYVPIAKADEDQRIVYGVVLEPDTVDLQGDVLTIDTIEEAAHKYLVEHRTVGDNHSHAAAAEVVESYLAPADMELGGQKISRGSWIMGVHVTDDRLWDAVRSGDYAGFSIGGTGARKEITKAVSLKRPRSVRS